MRRALFLCLLGCAALLAAQEIPMATETPSHPFFIRKTWFIGGAGNWDYLTMDPAAGWLYIAHGSVVQVVDVATGTLAGTIHGFREAHQVVLDTTGELGYVSDGPAGAVKVFERRTLDVIKTIPVGCSPRSIAFEPQSGLLFAVCAAPSSVTLNRTLSSERRSQNSAEKLDSSRVSTGQSREPRPAKSLIAIVDPQEGILLGHLVVPGNFGFAQQDGDGHVYISVEDRAEIARLDAGSIDTELEQQRLVNLKAKPASDSSDTDQPSLLDWSSEDVARSRLHLIRLGSTCHDPKGLIVDGQHYRLFAACSNQRLVVLNTNTGALVASLTTGPGSDALGYDADRGLLFVANGAGYGSLTIVRQDANVDSYAVIQNLPTREQARTLAVNPSDGEVYLVTEYHGADLTHPGGIGDLKMVPIQGSFQVLAIGN